MMKIPKLEEIATKFGPHSQVKCSQKTNDLYFKPSKYYCLSDDGYEMLLFENKNIFWIVIDDSLEIGAMKINSMSA